jgi:DNA-binding transcriptional LysR family regulator
MSRPLNFRQIEAFKAVIDFGTVSRAAEMLNISQPAMSQLIGHLEEDTGLKLFDRLKGRLMPTDRAMRLYDEVGRIFAGVRQVESTVEAIRREELGRLSIGVLPALAGSFIQRVATDFLRGRSKVFCSVQTLNSQWIVEGLIASKLDIGLVEPGFDSQYIVIEPLMEHPLVCIMPLDHPLTAKSLIKPQDLDQVPFIATNPESYLGSRVKDMFDVYNIRAQEVLVTNAALTVCEFVAAGRGVSLIHPLMASGLEHRLAVRRFGHEIYHHFQLCRSADSRNANLAEIFAAQLRATAVQISRSILNEP